LASRKIKRSNLWPRLAFCERTKAAFSTFLYFNLPCNFIHFKGLSLLKSKLPKNIIIIMKLKKKNKKELVKGNSSFLKSRECKSDSSALLRQLYFV